MARYICTICAKAIRQTQNNECLGCGHEQSVGDCDRWAHWHCVGISKAEDQPRVWYCQPLCCERDRRNGLVVEGDDVWIASDGPGKPGDSVEDEVESGTTRKRVNVDHHTHNKRLKTISGTEATRTSPFNHEPHEPVPVSQDMPPKLANAPRSSRIDQDVWPLASPLAKSQFWNNQKLANQIGDLAAGKLNIVCQCRVSIDEFKAITASIVDAKTHTIESSRGPGKWNTLRPGYRASRPIGRVAMLASADTYAEWRRLNHLSLFRSIRDEDDLGAALREAGSQLHISTIVSFRRTGRSDFAQVSFGSLSRDLIPGDAFGIDEAIVKFLTAGHTIIELSPHADFNRRIARRLRALGLLGELKEL
ncbi:hypothetical protein C8F01DRAFT_1108372 [Mycena amicta]|nr:hypothetical protein C8F01DRAFT_1108372 [Mycena amicta]